MSSSLDQRSAKANENTADKSPHHKEGDDYGYASDIQVPTSFAETYPHGSNAGNADAYMGYYWSPYQNTPNNNMQAGYQGREGVYGGYPPNDYVYNQYDYSYWYQNVDPASNSWTQQQQQQYYKARDFPNGDSFYSGAPSGSNHDDYNNVNGTLQTAEDSFKGMSLNDEDKDFPSSKKSWANVVNSSKMLPRSKTIPRPPLNFSKGDPAWDKSKFSRQVAPGPYSALNSAASLEFQPPFKADPPVDKPTSGENLNRQVLDYNPKNFDLSPMGARFFVIKSFSEDDIHRSIKYSIWCSTEYGNKRLDAAFKERDNKGQVYLFFSVNGSGHFCGVALMTSAIDYNSSAEVWAQNKWKGQFSVRWVYVKDVPNSQLRHIKLENNENKPVTNSRDTQEIPGDKGKQVLRIIHQYHHNTSIFDDFYHYERQQEETQLQRK